jgi:hypothetical protein
VPRNGPRRLERGGGPPFVALFFDARNNWQNAGTRLSWINGDKCTAFENRSIQLNCGHDEVAYNFRQGILSAHLNYAWPKRVRDRKDYPEVEIMCEHHETVFTCIGHDLSVFCSRIADIRPMDGTETVRAKVLCPCWAEIHVDRDYHDDDMGTSNSSDRHAA